MSQELSEELIQSLKCCPEGTTVVFLEAQEN